MLSTWLDVGCEGGPARLSVLADLHTSTFVLLIIFSQYQKESLEIENPGTPEFPEAKILDPTSANPESYSREPAVNELHK